MTNIESQNVLSHSHTNLLSLFSQMVSFFFILCLSLCSFGLCSAPLPPARIIHDKAWRPAVDTGPSDTGSFLTALASFSNYFQYFHEIFPLHQNLNFSFGMIIFTYGVLILKFYTARFVITVHFKL